MSKPSHDNWMPLYPGAYLRQTGRLTTAQHGAYLLLIMEAWAHDGLIPDDDEELAQITRMTPRDWRANREKVLRFWTPVDGGFRQERIDQELARAKDIVAKKSEAGKASAEARKNKKKGNDGSTPVGTPVGTDGTTDGQQTGRPSQSPYSDTNVSGAAAPIDADQKAWREAVSVLTAGGWTNEARARSLFGRLLSENGIAAKAMLPALAKCIEIGTQDPAAYLRKAAQGVSERRSGGTPAPLPAQPDGGDINWPLWAEAWKRDRTWPVSILGPTPNEPGCKCPPELLEA